MGNAQRCFQCFSVLSNSLNSAASKVINNGSMSRLQNKNMSSENPSQALTSGSALPCGNKVATNINPTIANGVINANDNARVLLILRISALVARDKAIIQFPFQIQMVL